MSSKYFISLLLFGHLVISASGQSLQNTVTGNNQFAFELYKKVFNKESDVFLSPYSISSALAMTYAGARNETEKQMSKVLHFDLNQTNTHEGFFEINSDLKKLKTDSVIKLSVANALWKDEGTHFKNEFLELTKKYYDASIFPLAGAKPINDWAEKETNGKIKEIVNEEDLANARLVLTNAIYFKGDWLKSFNEKDTKKDSFTITKNKKVVVDMMFQKNEAMYFEDEQNQVLELPYKGESITMTIILPKQNSSISKLATNIDYKLFSYYNSVMKKRKIEIYIPKFKIASEFQLGGVLSDMGMSDAFNPVKADFSGMSSAGLSISKVIHKTFIEVNEKGSEAAAVTAVVMGINSLQRDLIFKADRPFMIFITDKQTNSILFMGAILNPAE